MAEKRKHLRDLFNEGTKAVIQYGDEAFEIWLQRPSSVQEDDAFGRGRAKRARLLAKYNDKDSDEYVTMKMEVDALDRDALLAELLDAKNPDHKSQAMSEVLYGPEGSDWGESGEKYLDLVEAVQERLEEIVALNESATEAQNVIMMDQDDEMVRLNAEQEKFDKEVDERFVQLQEGEKARLDAFDNDRLRKMVWDHRVDALGNLAWYSEYRLNQLHYACRYIENKDELYFEDVNEFKNLPPTIQQAISNNFDAIDVSGADLKKLLSPLNF